MYQPPPRHPGPPFHQGPPHGPPIAPEEAASFAPTVLVNTACIGLVLVSLLLFLLMARLLFVVIEVKGGLIAVAHGVLGLLALGGAVGVRSGRVPLAVVGLAVCPLAALASIFALLTGSIAGLAGIVVSIATPILIAISLRDVARMGSLRKAVLSDAPPRLEDAPPSGPISDLPRMKARRWPVLVALLAVVVVGSGGAAFGIRFAASAERAKEASAFRSLEACLLGRAPSEGVPPSLLYRRMEIRFVVEPPSVTPFPARCATHAHALFESRRRSSGDEKKADGTGARAEHLGKLLADRRGESLYDAIDQFWALASKEGYPPAPNDLANEAGGAAPSWLDDGALSRVAPFSKKPLPLSALRTDRVAGTTLHVLVDGVRQPGEGRLCTLASGTFRCAALPASLDRTALSLLGSAEGDAAPLLFAGGGSAGIYRLTGELIGETPSYGGVARADGSVATAGYDRRVSKFVLLRAGAGGAPTRTLFSVKGVSDDRQLAQLDDNFVWATDDGALSVARLLPSGPALGAKSALGSTDELGAVQLLDGCRSREAFFLLVGGSRGAALAIDTGDRWSDLVPTRTTGDATFDCAGKEAFILRQRVALGGTGAVSLERCAATGCQHQTVDLDDVFKKNPEILPKIAPLALPLDGKLLLVWRAGTRGGVRMRLAPVEHIAEAEDVVVFDDRVQDGHVTERSNLREIGGFSREGHAVVFLSTASGTWPLDIDGTGKVTPIETVR